MEDKFEQLIWTADWSPNGSKIAVGGNYDTLKIITVSDYSSINIPMLHTITKVKWHPLTSRLAVLRQFRDDREDPQFHPILYDQDSGDLTSLEVNGGRGLGWNSDGSVLAIGEGEGELSVFSNEGQLLERMETQQKSITGLSWHPFKNVLVTIGSHIEIINLDNKSIKRIQPRPAEVLLLSVEWHPRGDFFVTGDYGDFDFNLSPLLQFWDESGNLILDSDESTGPYRNLRWSENGKFLATASDALRIWSPEGKLLNERSFQSFLWGIDWHPSGDQLVATSGRGQIFIVDNELSMIKQIEY